MTQEIFRLLTSRRFLPLFLGMFLGALNDNLFKNATALLLLYRLGGSGDGRTPQILVSAAAGIFILPYFLFSATAGQLADRLEKSRVIRWVKLLEIPLTLLAAVALFSGSGAALLVMLFLLGGQATFFGPVKYAILPELLAEEDLVGGNALMEAGTFLAILLGTIASGLLILTGGGILMVSTLMVAAALAGYAASRRLPPSHPGQPEVVVSANILADTRRAIASLGERRTVFLATLGISWFWFFGATFLALFPIFAKLVLAADEHAVTLMLTMFALGIGLGSALCARLLKGEISARTLPYAALGMSLFAADLALASPVVDPTLAVAPLAGLGTFLSQPRHWRLLADLLLIAICGGLYTVPLYTLLQAHSAEAHRSRAVAVNNIMNALFMVVSAGLSSLLLGVGWTVPQIFLATAVLNLLVAVPLCRRGALPRGSPA